MASNGRHLRFAQDVVLGKRNLPFAIGFVCDDPFSGGIPISPGGDHWRRGGEGAVT